MTAAALPAARAAGAGRHVVIVEDNGAVASMLETAFRASGYYVSVAATAAAAVAACEAAVAHGMRADLMLLDLSLPDASGLSALERAIAGGVAPRITVALTGHADPAVAAACRASGCRDVLVKPLSVRELLSRAAAWLA